jgi:hypothetical protein
MPVAFLEDTSVHRTDIRGDIDMPTTHRSAWLACALCAFAATATSGQGSTGGALPPPKNERRQQREDRLKADQA